MIEARTFLQKATEAYGNKLPDWVKELAAISDREGLGGAAKRINYSKAAVSNVINGKYSATDASRIEGMVRGALMSEKVDCPVIGEIGRDRCLLEQSEDFRATSATRVALWNACKRCPHSRQMEGDNE